MVLVATVRALKMHGGGPVVTPGAPLKPEYTQENIELLRKGIPNLLKHIGNGTKHGIPVVVAINKHATDTETELEIVRKAALEGGAFDALLCTHWSDGGAGAVDLAEAVIAACDQPNNFHFLYDLNKSIKGKILTIAKEMYGAGTVEYSPKVNEIIDKYTAQVIFMIVRKTLMTRYFHRALINFQYVWQKLRCL